MSVRPWGIGAVTLVLLSLLPAAAAADPRVASRAADQSPADVRQYWTEERMANAVPLDLEPAVPPAVPAVPTLRDEAAAHGKRSSVGPDRFAATTITDTTAPGTRTHGKIFASTPFFDYVCSGTVVNSPNLSTVWTAAHCIYDTEDEVFADNLIFVPGYNVGARPFGNWTATRIFAPSSYISSGGDLRDDVGAAKMQVKKRGKTTAEKRRCNRIDNRRKRRRCKNRMVPFPIQDAVGARGITFNQDFTGLTYSAIGYPVIPQPRFDGQHMERCVSPVVKTDPNPGTPNPIGIACDMQGGSSGGGWVISGARVNGNVSYGYPGFDDDHFYSPYFDGLIKGFYDAVKSQ